MINLLTKGAGQLPLRHQLYLRCHASKECHGGNVRKLENVVERPVVLYKGRHVTIDDLPPNLLHAAAADAED
jgi:transcriptional regulator of acetoin/glycerol metabolism